MSNFTFAAPWLLLLLPTVAVLAAILCWRRSKLGPVGMIYADTRLVSGSGKSVSLQVIPFLRVMRFVALALLLIAAARPQIGEAREVVRGEGVDIAIALDISGSMGETDLKPHRLQAAKDIIAEFIGERRFDRIGLVVFSREAFIQSPPTLDHTTLLQLLGDVHLSDQLGIEDGTAMGTGMATAANMLKDSTSDSKLVTLITDGISNAGELDPITAATAAATLDIKLYTIGVGSHSPRTHDIPEGSSIDEESLQRIAAITNAKFYRATDTEGLRDIYAEIDSLEKSDVEILHFTRHRELAAWLIVPALLLLVVELTLSQTVLRRLP